MLTRWLPKKVERSSEYDRFMLSLMLSVLCMNVATARLTVDRDGKSEGGKCLYADR